MDIKLASDNAIILWDDNGHVGAIEPTHDLTGYALEIQDFAATVWTVAFIDAWRLEHYPPPTLAQVKERKIQELRTACRDAIFAGFSSSALGTAHHYPSKQDAVQQDQLNLAGLVAKSHETPLETFKFWCADSLGVWDRRAHSAEQIRAVGVAGANHVIAAQDKFASLSGQVAAATTIAGVELIVW